ncbi:helix-turn-helix domain-containing protein [Desulfurococcus mucosus]|uniref:Transcriptional regulator-like protein n=1 Tax=Desulfurococcus mucosus (strain ATCC 35584 / DSM 2162 / JCM 9187 / O7/1) TaxID=765177 RepID=E8R9I0_DESM0|nr:transcriptional regulator [Desulfurococcus mucosus]ADV65156.1 transcriptional regulator-like protein [Desulfurococcus mucosus DSM 2162]
MKAFCEVLNRKIMPTAKSYIAVKLVREYGFTQLEVARILDMKQSAVNYVLTGRRKPKYYESLLSIHGFKQLLDETAASLGTGGSIGFNQCDLCRSLFLRGLYRSVIEAVGEPVDELISPARG